MFIPDSNIFIPDLESQTQVKKAPDPDPQQRI